MDFLPSKKFLIRALSLTLILGAWLLFSKQSTGKIMENENGSLENKNGVLVFSRNKTNYTNNFENTLEWSDDSEKTTNKDSYSESQISDKNIANVSENYKPTTNFKPFKLSNLNISEENNIDSFKKYASSFAQAMKPYSVKNLPNEGYLVLKAIEEENREDLKKIEVMSQLHKVVSNTLLSISAPKDVSGKHLNLINSTSKISYLDSILSKAFENPTDVMPALNEYKKETEKLVSYINDINNFFIEKGVEFEPGEQINIYINMIK